MSEVIRSEEEIADQIARLEAAKPNVPRRSAFGRNNWGHIDIALDVLRELEDPEGDYADGRDEQDEADFTWQWLCGESLAEDGSPAENWEGLVGVVPVTLPSDPS